MKNKDDKLQEALNALRAKDEQIKLSFFLSCTLSFITRRPAHLASLSTAYLLGERPTLEKRYQEALNGRTDNYSGLLGDSQYLKALHQNSFVFFNDVKNAYEKTEVSHSLEKLGKNITEEIEKVWKKK